MNENEISILISIAMIVLLSRSLYIHYIVKDGWARIMLLFISSMLWFFLAYRIFNVVRLEYGFISAAEFRSNAYWSVFSIYSIVVGQFLIQNWGKKK